jgi:hypothetical protein
MLRLGPHPAQESPSSPAWVVCRPRSATRSWMTLTRMWDSGRRSLTAVNLYINLQGREPNGTVSKTEYRALQQTLVSALKAFVDTNPSYTQGVDQVSVFDKVFSRPLPDDPNDPSFGLGTSKFIGQDSGDVFALLTVGYNFDGTQTPIVQRQGDPATGTPILSLPNFYGAHGYDPRLRNMSAIFFAAGPDIRHGSLTHVHNIDVAPTVARILG